MVRTMPELLRNFTVDTTTGAVVICGDFGEFRPESTGLSVWDRVLLDEPFIGPSPMEFIPGKVTINMTCRVLDESRAETGPDLRTP